MASGRVVLMWFRESIRRQLALVLAPFVVLFMFNAVFVFGYISDQELDDGEAGSEPACGVSFTTPEAN